MSISFKSACVSLHNMHAWCSQGPEEQHVRFPGTGGYRKLELLQCRARSRPWVLWKNTQCFNHWVTSAAPRYALLSKTYVFSFIKDMLSFSFNVPIQDWYNFYYYNDIEFDVSFSYISFFRCVSAKLFPSKQGKWHEGNLCYIDTHFPLIRHTKSQAHSKKFVDDLAAKIESLTQFWWKERFGDWEYSTNTADQWNKAHVTAVVWNLTEKPKSRHWRKK